MRKKKKKKKKKEIQEKKRKSNNNYHTNPVPTLVAQSSQFSAKLRPSINNSTISSIPLFFFFVESYLNQVFLRFEFPTLVFALGQLYPLGGILVWTVGPFFLAGNIDKYFQRVASLYPRGWKDSG